MQKIRTLLALMAVTIGLVASTCVSQAFYYNCGSFTDVPGSTPLCDAATYVNSRNIMGQGINYLQQQFRPYDGLNRAEAVTVVLRSFDANGAFGTYGNVDGSQLGFRDTPYGSTQWWYGYVNRARQLGFVNGYSDGFFRAGNSVTRAEFLKMFLAASPQVSSIYNYQYGTAMAGISNDAWYYKYLNFAAGTGMLNNISCGNGFCPDSPITRGEVAQMIYNYKLHFGDVGGFVVNGGGNNGYAPTLLSPSNGQVFGSVNTVNFSWTAVPNATSYRIQVRTAGTNNYVLDQTAYSNSYSWYQSGSGNLTYYWKVIAYTTNGSTYTSNENYYSFGGIGGTPVLYSPSSGQVFPAGAQYINFTWSAVSGASYYRIQIRNSNSSTYFFDQTTNSNSYTSYQNYSSPVTYYWRVWSYDSYGNSNVSGEYSYSLGNGSVGGLAAPVLSSPYAGQVYSNSSNQTINFSWSAAQNASYYRIKVRTSDSQNYFIDQVVYGTSYSYYFNVLNQNASYYWTVYAYDNNGNSMWPAENNFSFQGKSTPTNNLGSFQLSTPAANTTLSAVNQTVNFTWTPATNATYYIVKIRLSTSSSYFVNATVTTNSYSYPFVVGGNNLSYMWTVEAHDANGNVAYPPNGTEYLLNFKVQQTTLAAPQIIGPNNTTFAYRMGDAPGITFSWNATPGATSYKFFCSAAEGMTCNINGTVLGNVTTYTPAMANFPPKAPITAGAKGTWSWYVRASDANGNYADSQYGIFTVQQ